MAETSAARTSRFYGVHPGDDDAEFLGEWEGKSGNSPDERVAQRDGTPTQKDLAPQEVRVKRSVVFADEDGGAQDRGPEAALVAYGRLRDVHRSNDFVRDAVNLFFLVERQIRIEFHVQSRR
jgi:hypothetical protein